MSPLPLPSQYTLAAGLTIYPLLLFISLPVHPSPARLAQSREAISIANCALMTLLSPTCLRQSDISALLSTNGNTNSSIHDRDLPINTTRSEFANAITALETAYLLQDSAVLVYASRLAKRAGRGGSGKIKGLNVMHLASHHAGLSVALSVLQIYIAQGQEKGVLIIIMMMLMNASSPLGTLRWFLVNFRPGARWGIMLTTVAYLAMFGVCRVHLVYYILDTFGAQKGSGAVAAFGGLKSHCQLGTGAMGVVNAGGLLWGWRGLWSSMSEEILGIRRIEIQGSRLQYRQHTDPFL